MIIKCPECYYIHDIPISLWNTFYCFKCDKSIIIDRNFILEINRYESSSLFQAEKRVLRNNNIFIKAIRKALDNLIKSGKELNLECCFCNYTQHHYKAIFRQQRFEPALRLIREEFEEHLFKHVWIYSFLVKKIEFR